MATLPDAWHQQGSMQELAGSVLVYHDRVRQFDLQLLWLSVVYHDRVRQFDLTSVEVWQHA